MNVHKNRSSSVKPIAPFGYYGGKSKMFGFINENIPDGESFLDLFGGSGVVCLSVAYRFSNIVYNDLNSRLYRFFKTLRECPHQVIDQIALTPSSREEYEKCCDVSEDPIEDARRVFVLVNQSFMKKGLYKHSTGWQFQGFAKHSSGARSFQSRKNKLPMIVDLLKNIDIENRDWRDIIHLAKPTTVIFADPPYDLNARKRVKGYKHEMTDDDHSDLASRLSSSPAAAVVCGYRSELYDQLYSGDEWVRKDLTLNCTFRPVKGSKQSKRTECLWIKGHIPHKDGLAI